MELPIAPQTYQPPADALLRAIKRVELMLARTACDETSLDVATVLTRADRPALSLTNFAADVRLPPDHTAAQVLDAIDAAFAEAGSRCHRLISNDADWPEELAREAEARGYQRTERQLMLLHGYRPPQQRNEALQVIPGRAVYGPLCQMYEQSAREEIGLDPDLAAQFAATLIDHLDEPRIDIFLGRLNGRIAGVVSVVTLGQIGVIDNVHTVPVMRHQGVATTLLAHAMDHCQRALFEQVILETTTDNTNAIRLYEKLGFKPLTTFAHYERSMRP